MRGWFLVAALYLIVLVKLLFFKLTINFSTIAITDNHNATFSSLLAGSNFVPFYRIYYYMSGQEPYLVGALNLVGNVLLFVPMGFFLPLFFKEMGKAKKLLVTMVIMCLSIEVLQLLTVTGQFDVDDVILNVLGAMGGYWLFRRLKPFLPHANQHKRLENRM